MTPQEIALVRTSFAAVRPIADQAAALFYERLFTLDPALRPMFKGDMRAQGAKLMQMIGLAVAGLDSLPTLCRPCTISATGTAATACNSATTKPSAPR